MSSVTMGTLTSLGLYKPSRSQILWTQARSRVPVHSCSWAEYWVFILASGSPSSLTLYHFPDNVFSFLHLLVRPDNHGFSNMIHTFLSWSHFLSNVSECNALPAPFLFIFKILLTVLDSELHRTFSLVEPLILNNLLQLAVHLSGCLQILPKIHGGQGLCFIHSL